jgi:cell division protein FtsI/penicillin-binding protein 2
MQEFRGAIMGRMFVMLGILFLLPAALLVQLVRINFIEGDGLRQLWNKQAITEIPIPAERGNIYDRNGTLLATNTVDYKMALDPKVPGMTQAHIDTVLVTLGRTTGKGKTYYQGILNEAPTRSRYVVMEKNMNGMQKEQLATLGIRGVILEENYRRSYTFGSLAAHTMGFVNHEMKGRIGLESHYDKELRGVDGVQQVRKDALQRVFEYVGAPKKLPIEGYDLHTTIDASIQAILEDELQVGVQRFKANYGTGIIMDPTTGEILAMANYPSYDPNVPGDINEENRRNFAIADMVEPGSTFKLVTAIAAVEQGVIKEGELFETPEDGAVQIHGLTLRDHDPLGTMNFEEVIQQSSNVATAEIAMRLDNDTFYQYARNLGFGTPTHVDIAGEESGRMAKPFEWSLVSLPWMSHGYELLATPMQTTQAYAAFANRGDLMRPYLVREITNSNGKIVEQFQPTRIRKVAKAKTLDHLYPVFESVVSDSGTGDLAQIPGLRIAGKTGTAKKVVNGVYSNRYRGSFVGFFPVEAPKYVIYIMLDEPKPVGYGGYTAGPIFKQVALRIAGLDQDLQQQLVEQENKRNTFAIAPSLLGLSPDRAEELLESLFIPFEMEGEGDWIVDQQPAPGDTLFAKTRLRLNAQTKSSLLNPHKDPKTASKEGSSEEIERIALPDVRGMSMRTAHTMLAELGLKTQRIGSGTIYAQFPLAGEYTRPGRTVTLRGKARSFEQISEKTGRQQ